MVTKVGMYRLGKYEQNVHWPVFFASFPYLALVIPFNCWWTCEIHSMNHSLVREFVGDMSAKREIRLGQKLWSRCDDKVTLLDMRGTNSGTKHDIPVRHAASWERHLRIERKSHCEAWS